MCRRRRSDDGFQRSTFRVAGNVDSNVGAAKWASCNRAVTPVSRHAAIRLGPDAEPRRATYSVTVPRASSHDAPGDPDPAVGRDLEPEPAGPPTASPCATA